MARIGTDEVLTIVVMKIAHFATAVPFFTPWRIGGLLIPVGWDFLAVSKLQRSRIIIPITKFSTG